MMVERKCERVECGAPYSAKSSSKTKYCSRSCSATVNNSRYPKRPSAGGPKNCLNCGERLKNLSSKCCSRACHHEYSYTSYIARWLEGNETGCTPYGVTAQVRRWVQELYGMFCWECGWAKPHPETGIPPLQIDHIDGDAMNNKPENLRLLCGGCHTLTPTYGRRGGRKSTRTYRYNKK